MRTLTQAQRTGILERLRHNHKYSVVVSYQAKSSEEEATEFASILEEAGWTVSGPHLSENTAMEELEIGVRDPACPCPSAHLLLDVLVSAGLNTRFVKTTAPISSASFDSCCLQLGRFGSDEVLGASLNRDTRSSRCVISRPMQNAARGLERR